MKKLRFFSFLTLSMFLISCIPASSFPAVKSFFITPFELKEDEKKLYTSLALSPDGQSIAVASVGNRSLVNLTTGNREDLDKRFRVRENITLANHDLLSSDLVFWSFDGNYLGVLADHYEPTNKDSVSQVLYVFNMQNSIFNRYEIWSSAFSPFNSDEVLVEKGIYNLKNGEITSFSLDFDFTQEHEFGATYWFDTLWSKNLGMPIAQLRTLPYDTLNNLQVVIESFNPNELANPKYSVPIGFISNLPNQLIGMLFDPTGEYVLIAEWLCSDDLIPCTTSPSFHSDNVYDTVLTLINWQTKEKQELIRLSEIDPENVVAHGYMAWSADGSTIFISRRDASPVVLKLK